MQAVIKHQTPLQGVLVWAEQDSNLRPPLCKREERGFYRFYTLFMVSSSLLVTHI
jgi:hypothetical protein